MFLLLYLLNPFLDLAEFKLVSNLLANCFSAFRLLVGCKTLFLATSMLVEYTQHWLSQQREVLSGAHISLLSGYF